MPIYNLIRPKLHPSHHFKCRLRNRLHIKNPRSRQSFIKRVSKEALSVKEIPNTIFSAFLNYMAAKERYVRKRSPDIRLFLYQNWFVLASMVTGELVTIYDILPEWKGIYDRIRLTIDYMKLDTETSR